MLKVRCQAHATLDAKGRLALPALLRRAFQKHDTTSLVISHHRGAVWAWTPEDFEERVERPLEDCDQFSPEVRDFVDTVIAPAQDVAIDKQGRIRVPAMLRQLAGIEKDVVVISMLRRLEIWSREAWEQQFAAAVERRKLTQDGMPRNDG